MITAASIFSDVRSLMDDDNSGRYNETADLVPALNKAVSYLVAVFNSAFEAKKISPESLRDLSVTKILAVTGNGTKKCDLSTLTDLWTIFGVEPSPTVVGGLLSETVNRFASRLTLEQWNHAQADPFSPGTGVSILSDFVQAAYLGPGKFFGDDKSYLMIRPGSAFTADFVCIWYLKNPSIVATNATVLEFPQSLHSLLVDKTLNAISIQHGSESLYGKITDRDVNQVLQLMLS
jgi:hypothetical protein